MVASSEQHRAPVMVSKPATAHASTSQPGAPLNRDDSAEVMKMPEPIIEPMTIIVASIGPSARTRLDGGWLAILSLIATSAVRLFGRRRVPIAFAIRVRTQPRRVYRRERKSFPRAH